MPLLLTMSLCGSVGTLIYFILSPLTTRIFSLQWRKTYLTCCIFCFLIPFPCILTQYRNWIYKILTRFLFHETVEKPTFLNITGVAVQMTENGFYIHHGLIYAFIFCMFVVGVALFGNEFRKQMQASSYFQKNSNVAAVGKNCETIQEYITRNNINNIRICECDCNVYSPFTVGILNPIIVLPALKWEDQDLLEMVLEHETIHVKKRDNLIKMLALIVIVLNFYNPLSYYLLDKWVNAAEMYSDQKVLAGRTGDDVERYGKLIVDLSHGSINNRMTLFMGLSIRNQEKALKERILNMKKEVKKEKLLKRVLGVGTMGAALFLSSLSVLAYSPRQVVQVKMASDKLILSDKTVDTIDTEELDMNIVVGNDDEWVLDDGAGNIIRVPKEDGTDPQLFCKHEYSEYYLNAHSSQKDGGCIVNIYDAKRCDVCGHVVVGDLISTHTYVKCPH